MSRLAFAILLAMLHGISAATAQVYPFCAITMIVPFATGGPSDVVARVLSERLRTSLGQSIVIENVAGGGGSIGMGRVARSAPDGYTVGVWLLEHEYCKRGDPQPPYDVVTDFEPVVLLPANPLFIAANGAVPAKDLKDS
jgi:tripartite-type tricarboxylate transporter receptor subunit TctC